MDNSNNQSYLNNDYDKDDIDLRRKSVKALSCFDIRVILPISNLFHLKNNLILRVSCLKIFVRVIPNLNLSELPDNFFDVINIAIKDDEPQMILTVISLLRQLQLEGMPILKYLCRDSNVLRACAAITAISEVKDKSVEPFLYELLEDKSLDPLVKASIDQSLNLN